MQKIISMAAVFVFVLLAAGTGHADVTVESVMKSSGVRGMGAFDGATVVKIQGVKKAETSTMAFSGAIMSRLAGSSEQTTITRVDKGLIWQIDPKKKTYSEARIEPFKPAGAPAKDAQQEKPKVRISRTEFSVKKTGAKETINGYDCEEYLITWLIELEDLETKAKSTTTMNTNLWTTPETAEMRKLQAEETAFAKAYMKKVGLNLSPNDMKQYGMEAFAMMSNASPKEMEKAFARFKTEAVKIKGYPIRTVVAWKAQEQPGPAAAAKAKPEDASPADSNIRLDSVGGFVSGIAGAFAKKTISEKAQKSADGPFFSSTMEVKRISTSALSAESFEVPDGFSLK